MERIEKEILTVLILNLNFILVAVFTFTLKMPYSILMSGLLGVVVGYTLYKIWSPDALS